MDFIHLDMTNIPRSIHFPFSVHSMGYISSSTLRWAKNRYSDKIEFCLRISSEETFAIDLLDGKRYKTRFPHVIIKPPDVLHDYETKGHREAFYLMYSKTLIPALLKCGISIVPPVWELNLTPKITSLIQQLRSLFGSSREQRVAEQIDLLCFSLLEEIVFARSELAVPDNLYERKIRSIASYSQLHYCEDISIDELIRKNGLSSRTFFRRWKQYFPETPRQHIQTLKLNEVQQLLQNTDAPVAEIAEKLNFKGASYLIRLFKARFGMTPHQYRLQGCTPELKSLE